MVTKKPKGLGMGLEALLGPKVADRAADGAIPTNPGQPNTLLLTDMVAGMYQPRTRMDEGALYELAESIKAQGIMQPILVRKLSDGANAGKFEIIAGERRFRAAKLAGLDSVPVLVRDVPNEAAAAMALIENIQREDLNPMEEAQGLQRLIREFRYAAQSWDCPRRVITRLEFGSQGPNPRFIVTNLAGTPSDLYDGLYCQRGEAENRIKETQLDLFGTRASCHKFLANWLRVMFSALAYTLMQRLRELALAHTELAKASAATIRVRLLKIGAAVVRNTRRIRILLASHHPLREVYLVAANALASP